MTAAAHRTSPSPSASAGPVASKPPLDRAAENSATAAEPLASKSCALRQAAILATRLRLDSWPISSATPIDSSFEATSAVNSEPANSAPSSAPIAKLAPSPSASPKPVRSSSSPPPASVVVALEPPPSSSTCNTPPARPTYCRPGSGRGATSEIGTSVSISSAPIVFALPPASPA